MGKILSTQEISKYVRGVKDDARSIVLVGGCFDLLHRGHVEFLQSAAQKGDVLLVFLESDANVKRRKGAGRPIQSQEDRARVLSRIDGVDGVILLPDITEYDEYFELVKLVEPDIIGITEGDPYTGDLQRQAKALKSRVVPVIKRIKGYSTQELIQRTRNL